MGAWAEGVVAAPGTGVRQGTAEVSGMAMTVALAVAAGGLLAFRLDAPAFFDNEGRYAEVAREMVLRGDWISPHLNGSLFLNKPPLVFWLAAAVFHVAGPTEWARLVSIAAAIVALIATGRLGALLYGETTGLVATVALATTLGFVLEARTLRPDMVLIACTVVAFLCWRHARLGGAERTRWLAGLYAAIALGTLAKGLVVALVVAIPVLVLTWREEGWRGLLGLRPGLGLAVVGAIVLPWHLVVALRHPGFAWDYVVNQHLLFFLDRKLPRDSEGDSLVFFWSAYTGRAIPWVLLAVLTLAEGVRGRAPGADEHERATTFLWLWLLAVVGFFSCAPSRLEHYSLPALPATALLGARTWQRARTARLGAPAWWALGGVAVLVVGGGAAMLVVLRGVLDRTDWIREVPGLLDLIVPAGLAVAGMGLFILAGVARRDAGAVAAAAALGGVVLSVVLLRAEALAEPLFSWRPAAQALAALPPRTTIFFEAPEEYQLVGGLAYYTQRQIALLEPPGFVPPTYLRAEVSTMFVPRATFDARWRSARPAAFVSDPLRHRDTPDGLVPGPFRVVARFGDRWVLANSSAR